jgi:hypothetical protein
MSFPFAKHMLLQSGTISVPRSIFQEAVCEFSVPRLRSGVISTPRSTFQEAVREFSVP